MKISRILALFKRELLDIFRDKKTLFMMVVLPLLLYPLMIVGMTILMTSISSEQLEKTYTVALSGVSKEDETVLEQLMETKAEELNYQIEFKQLDTLLEDAARKKEAEAQEAKAQDAKAQGTETQEPGTASAAASDTEAQTVSILKDKLADACLLYDAAAQKPFQVEYLYANDDSATAMKAVTELLDAYNEQVQEEKIASLGLDKEELLHPIAYETIDHSTNEQSIGSVMGDMVPMLIIISIMMGAIYPAIDVTAGEKERGTLETLLTLPVTNFELIMSKFLAVSVIACVSAVLNIVSMGAAFGFMFSYMLGASGGVQIQLATFVPAIGFTILVMLFFALFVTAVSMCVCVFAKSFKEANNYVTPLMLVFMFASFVTMIPNVELDAMTAAVPVVNISLMIVKLFAFEYNYALFGIVLLSNVVYSLLAIMILGRIYNSETVLFSEGMGSLKLFSRRSEMKEKQIPGVGDVILLVCLELLLLFYAGTAAQTALGFGGVVVTQALILLVPLLYIWYMKADYKKVLSLRLPKPLHILGALLMWLGAFCVMCLVGAVVIRLFPESTAAQSSAFDAYMQQPFIILVLVIALMPAVGEELMFRGFIYGSLRDKSKNIIAMLVTSAIFGVYHLSLSKFFTTALLGFFLVLVVARTGSIFCSMLMHFSNNLLAVILMKYAAVMDENMPILTMESYGVKEVLIFASVAILGIGLGLALTRQKEQS